MPDGVLPSGYEEVEAAFLAARAQPPGLERAFAGAMSVLEMAGPGVARVGVAGLGVAGMALQRGGLAVARAIDAAAGGGPEPRYHNRQHMAEASWAMAWLCRIAVGQGLISVHQAVLGVVAMVGHDMLHDGSATSGGVLEARARAAVTPLLRGTGVPEAEIAVVGDVIAGTDRALVEVNAARLAGALAPGPMGAGQDALRCLANEADVCASLLPTLGPRLSRLLAAEWAGSGVAPPYDAGSACSRVGFLLGYPAASSPARVLGLAAARERCLAAYAAVGLALAGTATAACGGAALDGLAPAEAEAVYARALRGGG